MKSSCFSLATVLALCLICISTVSAGTLVEGLTPAKCGVIPEKEAQSGWKFLKGVNWIDKDPGSLKTEQLDAYPDGWAPIKFGVSLGPSNGMHDNPQHHIFNNRLTLWAKHFRHSRPKFATYKVEFNLKNGKNAYYWINNNVYICALDEGDFPFKSSDINRVNFYKEA